MADHSADVARALADTARTLNAPRRLSDTLTSIAQAALDTVPGFDHVGISVTHKDGAIETMAGTDQLVWDLDTVQYSLGQGPCVDSVRTDQTVVRLEHADQDVRWPLYLPQAVDRGLRSQLALRLYNDDQTIGGLNLYSTESDTIDSQAYDTAELFAAHASIALGHAQYTHQLNEAIATRQTIGQAVGIIMERYGISRQAAFEFLARASQTSNNKLRVLAEELVEASERNSSR